MFSDTVKRIVPLFQTSLMRHGVKYSYYIRYLHIALTGNETVTLTGNENVPHKLKKAAFDEP